jgi:HK97 family phage prohead protease
MADHELELLSLDRERRATAREIRVDDSGPAPRIKGYAAVFNRTTDLWPGYREVIRPGAFRKTLEDTEAPKLALLEHESRASLASTWGSPPLRLWEDEHGLGFEFEAPIDLFDGRELVTRLRRGLLGGMSFGFQAVSAPESVQTDRTILRELLEVRLYEVSPVAFPAYSGTSANLRALRADFEARALTDPRIRAAIQASPGKLPARAAPRRTEAERELDRY